MKKFFLVIFYSSWFMLCYLMSTLWFFIFELFARTARGLYRLYLNVSTLIRRKLDYLLSK